MELRWGQQVAAHDAWLGSLHGVLLVKDSGAVTHLVVKRGLGRRKSVIPVESIKKCVPEAIYTKMPLEEALQQPTLERLDDEQFIVALTPKTRVLAADGKKLKLKGVRACGQEHLVEWLVVSSRMSLRRMLLPFDGVTEFSTGKVTLAMEASGLRAMPAYRQDPHVEADLRERLGKAYAVSQGGLKGITLTVEEGVVAFHGNVKNPCTLEELRGATRKVRGASGLLMDVRSDVDVERDIASAVAVHARANGGPLKVKSRLGHVTLLGHLPDEDKCAKLVQAATAVPGVHCVELVSG